MRSQQRSLQASLARHKPRRHSTYSSAPAGTGRLAVARAAGAGALRRKHVYVAHAHPQGHSLQHTRARARARKQTGRHLLRSFETAMARVHDGVLSRGAPASPTGGADEYTSPWSRRARSPSPPAASNLRTLITVPGWVRASAGALGERVRSSCGVCMNLRWRYAKMRSVILASRASSDADLARKARSSLRRPDCGK
jgi:hypothetical protein